MVDNANTAGSSGYGAGSVSDILTALQDLVRATNACVDGLGALVPHNTSGQTIAAKLVQTGFVRVTGVSVYTPGSGVGTLYDAATLAGAVTAAAIYPVSAALGYFPLNMVFANGLVYVPSSAQVATIFYART